MNTPSLSEFIDALNLRYKVNHHDYNIRGTGFEIRLFDATAGALYINIFEDCAYMDVAYVDKRYKKYFKYNKYVCLGDLIDNLILTTDKVMKAVVKKQERTKRKFDAICRKRMTAIP